METNVGAFDGFFRTLLFITAVVVAIMTGQWWWMIPTAVLFATAALGWCPLYAIIGFNSNTPETGH
jgi:hypothetical protein